MLSQAHVPLPDGARMDDFSLSSFAGGLSRGRGASKAAATPDARQDNKLEEQDFAMSLTHDALRRTHIDAGCYITLGSPSKPDYEMDPIMLSYRNNGMCGMNASRTLMTPNRAATHSLPRFVWACQARSW